MAYFNPVDIDGQLADAMRGHKQMQGRAAGVPAEMELPRLNAQPVPGIPGVSLKSLLGERFIQRDRKPGGVVQGGIGPARVVTHLKTPGPVELNDAVHGGRDGVCGGSACGRRLGELAAAGQTRRARPGRRPKTPGTSETFFLIGRASLGRTSSVFQV